MILVRKAALSGTEKKLLTVTLEMTLKIHVSMISANEHTL